MLGVGRSSRVIPRQSFFANRVSMLADFAAARADAVVSVLMKNDRRVFILTRFYHFRDWVDADPPDYNRVVAGCVPTTHPGEGAGPQVVDFER